MLKDLIQSFFTRGSVAIINLLLLVASSRYLGITSRGEISIFILNIMVVQLVNEIYTGYSLLHILPGSDLKKVFLSGIIFSVVSCLVCNVALVLLNKQVAGYEYTGYFVSLLVVFNSFNCVLLLGRQKIASYNLLSLLQPLILLCGLFIAIFIIHDYTFKAYLFPLLISFGVAAVVSSSMVIRLMPLRPSGVSFSLKSLLLNGFFFQAATLLYMLTNRYNYYLLHNRESVGLYSSACSLAESVLIVCNSVSPVLLSFLVSRVIGPQAATVTLSLTRVVFVLTAMALIVILLIPAQWFVNLFGLPFASLRTILFWYAPAVLLISVSVTIAGFFTAYGRQRLVLIAYAGGFFCTFVMAPALIRYYAEAGAAMAAGISFLFVSSFLLVSFLRINRFPFSQLFHFSGDLSNIRGLFRRAQHQV